MIFGIDVASILLGGLAAGMVLFIVSVGLSVTMGLMGFVNLAHGAFAMIGGYVIVLSMNRWGVGFIPAMVLGFVLTAALSVVLERLLYARLYRAVELDQVLFTIGLVFVTIASVTLAVGPENQRIQLPQMLQGQMPLGFTTYRTYSVVLIIIGVAFVVALWLGFERTRMGAQIRAAVDNRRMAESLGINVNRLFTLTFAFGSGMAALGGGLGAEFLGLDPQYALKYLVFFLIVVAVGGLGRVTGVFYAALLIGVLDFVLKQYVPRGGTLYIYALTILLLLWRPQGLFGRGAGSTGGEKEDSSITLMGFGAIGFLAGVGWWLSVSAPRTRPFFDWIAHEAGLLGWRFYAFLAVLAAMAACFVVGLVRYGAHRRVRKFLLGLMPKTQSAMSTEKTSASHQNVLDLNRMIRVLVIGGVLIIGVCILWWLLYLGEVRRTLGAGDSAASELTRCFFFTGGKCGILFQATEFAGFITYNPVFLWIGFGALVLASILALSRKPTVAFAHPAALGLAHRHHLRPWEALPWALAIAAYFVFSGYLAFGTEVLVMILFALSLELALGYAGIITLGHAAFFGIGGYTAGLISLYAGWNEPISLLFAAAAVAGILGLLSGWVLLRTHGLTLLMLTLSFAALLEELCNQFLEYTGGFDGKNLSMAPILGRFEFNPLYMNTQYIYALVVLFVMFVVIRSIVYSPFGQSLTGIRENILRMPAVGTPVQWRLVLVYSMSAAIAGVAGALQAQTQQFVNQNYFSLDRSATVIIILILGGYGRLYGSFIGAVAYMSLAHFLSKEYPTAWQLGLGLLLVVIALFARNGVLGIGERLWLYAGARLRRKPA